MELEYNYLTGKINDVFEELNRSIGQYKRHYDVKIGITCNPERRKYEHSQSGIKWKKMVVKYGTTSVKYINDLEKMLIDHHWNFIENEIGGGGGPNGNSSYYYLYILLK